MPLPRLRAFFTWITVIAQIEAGNPTDLPRLRAFFTWITQPANFMLVFGALVPVYFVYLFISSYALPVPFSDQWELSGKLAVEIKQGHFPLDIIVSRDKGHRLVFMNLLTAASAFLFDWNPRIEAFVNPLFAAVNYILLLLMFKKQSPENSRRVVIPFSALVFSLYPFDTWIYSWNIAWIQVLCFFMAALYVLQKFAPGWRPLMGAAALAVCATFAFGNGFLTWAILFVVMGMLGYRRWYHFGFWLALGAAASGVFLLAGDSTGSTPSAPTLADIPHILHFIFTALGSPFSLHYFAVNMATLMGVLVSIVFLVNVYYLWQQDHNLAHLSVWLALAAYALGTVSVSALARFDADEPGRATAARYAAATMPLWVAVVAMMVMVSWRAGAAEENRHRYLKRGNLIFAALLIPLYLQANLVVMQLVATEFNRVMAYRHSTPSAAEICVRDYPLYRDHSCLDDFPFNGGASPFFVYRIAAYRLSIFAREEPVFILPDTYREGSPIILDTPSIWLNSYVRDTLLGGLAEEYFFHIAPDGDAPYPDILPEPLIRLAAEPSPETLAEIEAFIGSADQVWYIGTPETAEHNAVLQNAFAGWGYLPTVSPIEIERYRNARFLILRYQRAPENMQTLYWFDDNISLQAWSAGEQAAYQACGTLTIQSWWRTQRAPDFNYSATFTLVNESGDAVARADGQLANIPMLVWEPNQLYLDERRITLPCDLPPGDYDILVGIYHYETLEDLPVTLPDGSPAGNRAYLTSVAIEK